MRTTQRHAAVSAAHTVAIAIVFAFSCATQSAPPPAEPPSSTVDPGAAAATDIRTTTPNKIPIGVYKETHTIRVVCQKPDWCEQSVQDRLAVGHLDPRADTIEVAIDLVQANAHTCGFRGKLSRTGERTWRHNSDTDGSPCDLTVAWREPTIEVRSEGCREWCGARASLWADFTYPPAIDRFVPLTDEDAP